MIAANLIQLATTLPEQVTLVAVSKTKPNESIIEAYAAGQRHFGENKVQELVGKAEVLPEDILWHQIGHLQSNKVKYIAPFVHLIHAIDSLKLLKEVNKQGKKNDRVINCLLQFHIAQESTKFGFSAGEVKNLLDEGAFDDLTNIKICGVMGMASFTNDEAQVRSEFGTLKNVFGELKAQYFTEDSSFAEISMGMSGDFEIAIEEGATMVRVGSAIFGSRN